jgi:signal transduction histidine kinase/CheY-like chemotaxis protein
VVNISLIAFFAFLAAGLYLLWIGYDEIHIRRFSLLFFLAGIIALASYYHNAAQSIVQAHVSVKTGIAAIIAYPAGILFFLLKPANFKITTKSLIITLTPLIILLMAVIFNFSNHIQIIETGEKFIVKFDGVFKWIYGITAIAYFGLIIAMILKWRKTASLNRQKLRANFFMFSIILSALIFSFDFFVLKNQIFGLPHQSILFALTFLLATMALGVFYFQSKAIPAATEHILLMSLSNDLIFYTDLSGKILKYNHQVMQTFGNPSDDTPEPNIIDLIWDTEIESFRMLLNGREGWEDEFNCTNIKNEKFPVKFRASTIYDKYSDPAGFIIVGKDKRPELKIKHEAAQNRELQYELLKAKEKATESDKLKSAFLSIITHELRTPLNGILGFTELLKAELEGSEYFEIVDHIDKSGKRLLGTINSIIDLSLIETNKNEINKQPVNLKTLLRQKSKTYIAYAQSKNLYFELTAQTEGLMSRTDERMVGHILTNLMDNAVKYTEKGGIKVSLEAIERNNRVKALFKVADTGIGIKKNDFSKIFDRFRQGSEGYNRTYEGMGIGLSICKTFVEMLDGEIWVDSTPDQGSVFYLQLPAYFLKNNTDNVVFDENEIIDIDQTKDRPCALIVEDNHSNRAFMKYLLLEKYEVDDTINGIGALDLAQKNQYDLIFISLDPEKEIIEVEAMKKIKRLPGYEKVPIAAVTTNLQKNEQLDLFYQGFTHYLPKPYTRETLLAVAQKMISRE